MFKWPEFLPNFEPPVFHRVSASGGAKSQPRGNTEHRDLTRITPEHLLKLLLFDSAFPFFPFHAAVLLETCCDSSRPHPYGKET